MKSVCVRTSEEKVGSFHGVDVHAPSVAIPEVLNGLDIPHELRLALRGRFHALEVSLR